MSVNVRSMEIFQILKRWCWSKECLCRQCLAVFATTRGNTTTLFDLKHHHRVIWWVLSKNSKKRYGTKYCKRISVRAPALSPFINEQVFVSRQRIQIDSIGLLDKWLLHLLQEARRKHKKRQAHYRMKRHESLLQFHCCHHPDIQRSHTGGHQVQLLLYKQLGWPGEENLRDCWCNLIIGAWWGVIMIRDSVLLGFLHMAPIVYTDTITVINKISLIIIIIIITQTR